MGPLSRITAFLRGEIIDHQSGQPMDYVDYLLDEEYASHPTSLIDIPESGEEHSNRLTGDAQARHISNNTTPDPDVPLGKQVW